jgi:hypothetical protein
MMKSILEQSPSSCGRPADVTESYNAARMNEPEERGVNDARKKKAVHPEGSSI